jgi:hypothetical protein
VFKGCVVVSAGPWSEGCKIGSKQAAAKFNRGAYYQNKNETKQQGMLLTFLKVQLIFEFNTNVLLIYHSFKHSSSSGTLLVVATCGALRFTLVGVFKGGVWCRSVVVSAGLWSKGCKIGSKQQKQKRD